MVTAVGLEVYLEFFEVAIAERGGVRSAGRVETKLEHFELFAQSLGPDDRVALEVTGKRVGRKSRQIVIARDGRWRRWSTTCARDELRARCRGLAVGWRRALCLAER